MTIRILLADDHPVVASGVRWVLQLDPTLQVVGTVESPDQLHGALEATPCDLVITDFSMPGDAKPDGLSMISLMRRRRPELPIIVLTRIQNPAVLRSIRDAGVQGIVIKSDALTELTHAVYTVMSGRTYIGSVAKQALAKAAVDSKTATTEALSAREAEVFRLFASGMSVKDIAKQLHRSAKTISNQKLAAMEKLGLKTDLEIYAYASEHGLLS